MDMQTPAHDHDIGVLGSRARVQHIKCSELNIYDPKLYKIIKAWTQHTNGVISLKYEHP